MSRLTSDNADILASLSMLSMQASSLGKHSCMRIRYVLCVGDRAGGAVIIEGTGKTYRGRRLAAVGMDTYCSACGQRGLIAPRGVRSPGPEQQLALSGDVNLCGCEPAPVFELGHGMALAFAPEDVARWEASQRSLGVAPARIDAAGEQLSPLAIDIKLAAQRDVCAEDS
jgi:hypothetical protein